MKRLLIILCILSMAVPALLWAGTPHYNWIYIPKYPDPESENYPVYMDNFFNDVDEDLWNINQIKLNADTSSPSNATDLTISPCFTQDADGGIISCLDISWTDSINTDIDFYEIRYKPQGSSVYSYMQTTLKAIRISGLVGDTTYCVSVKGVDKQGNSSGYPTDNCTAVSGADPGISSPTGAATTAGFKQIWLDWVNPTAKDLALIEIWRADTNDRATAAKIAEVKTDFYSDSLDNGVTKYYWVRAKDLSGNLSSWSPAGATSGIYATTLTIITADIGAAQVTNTTIANATIDLVNKVQGQLPNSNLAQITDPAKLADAIITGAKIATGAIDNTKLVTGLTAIAKLATLPSLPDANYPQGSVVFLTTNNKLYRTDGTVWTATLHASDLSGTISTSQITNGAITTVKLGDSQVSTEKMADGSITSSKIGDAQVTTTKIGDNAITKVKFGSGLQAVETLATLPSLPDANYPQGSVVFLTTNNKLYRTDGTVWTATLHTSDLSGTISTSQLANGAVTTVKLGDSQVSATKLADGSISQVKIASGNRILDVISTLPSLPDANYPQGATAFLTTDNKLYRSTGTSWTAAVPAVDINGQITSTQITDSAISTPKLAANAVTAANIAANTITANEIATNAITSDEIVAGAIITSKIATGAITSNEIAANTITASDIQAYTITAEQIATDTITAGNIAAGAIASSELATGAVVAGKIAAGTIVAADIAADTITAGNIAANAITVSELAANAVTSDKIVAGTITASDIATGTITATNIAAGTITGSLIAADTIAGSNIIAGTIVASDIATDAITTNHITAGAVQAGDIQAGAITSTHVSTNQIITTSANIADAVITSAKIADATIQTADIANGQITDAKIAYATITEAAIANATITGAKIANATITDANIANLTADKITAGTLTGSTIQTNSSNPKGVLSSATKDLRFYNSSGTQVATITGNDDVGGALKINHGYSLGYGVNIPAASITSSSSIATLGVGEYANRTAGDFLATLTVGTSYSTNGQVIAVRGIASADYVTSFGGWFSGETADLVLGGTELYKGSSISKVGSGGYKPIAIGVFGTVASNGTTTSGTGFAVSHPSGGTYDITFTSGNFISAPTVIATIGNTNNGTTIRRESVTTSGFRIVTFLGGGQSIGDSDFSFFAIAN